MTDIFELDAELDEPGAVDEVPSIFQAPDALSTGWQPGQGGGFAALVAGLGDAPEDEPQKPAKKPRRGRKKSAPDSVLGVPVKPLPAPKAVKKLSKGQQAKADKAQRTKELNADAAAMRINGTDGDVEIPKKPWITVFSGKRARPDEVAETLTDLASMLENGQSEFNSVEALAVQYADYDIGQAYERVTLLLDRGVTLSAAMADQEDNFPPVVRELIGAAKMPKDMHRNLRQAAIIIVEADNIKSQLKSATFKPGLMFFFLIVFALAAVQWLLPMTTGMFTGIGAEVPPLTKTIMTVGEYLKWVLLAVLLLAMMWKFFWAVFGKTNERLATINDTMALKAPLVGDIMRMAVAARFCDVLAACLAVGMSEIEALETAGRACGNRALAQWVNEHVGRQRVGLVAFSDVSKTEMLPWNFRNRIETTSSLTRRIEILRELAETFHHKSQQRLNRFAERVGPITEGIVVAAVLVVVLLIISPILSFIPTMLETMKK
ncbi:type II secretion system F family protein [Arthrobacter sp. ES1]|uniref:type II secretion system F family protein n=1 Tax=Arthrobacter sp. ES1 TaxID=1897056 RepID=UPI001D00173F|nr:type II secretion system F family protein [Arthrobacter sp. ES1]MCB5280328.1 Type II secretion system protein F [Arthrobacter sp. ES1]